MPASEWDVTLGLIETMKMTEIAISGLVELVSILSDRVKELENVSK